MTQQSRWLYERLGRDTADRLLAKAWNSWRPVSTKDVFSDFAAQLLAADSASGGNNTNVIRQILQARKILP